MIPGSNLLAAALTVIAPQPVEFLKATGRVINAQGRETVTFAPPRTIYGSFQPLNAARAISMGLDAEREYAAFYAQTSFAAPSREGPADIVVFAGEAHRVISVISWLAQDGWDGVTLVKVGNDV